MPAPRLRTVLRLLLLVLGLSGACSRTAADLVRREWLVDGVRREGLVSLPAGAKSAPTPLVFAFHGHGGSAEQAARSFRLHELWPEAIVVYLQGLPTKGQLTDAAGRRNGWQGNPGDEGDRDLRFFDVVLASLKSDYRVDDRRIYATGHSNGGSFTYLLWAMRGDVFAAYAPSSAVAGRSFIDRLRPAPVLHVAGRKDPLVKFAWQEQMIARLVKLNGCGAGQSAGRDLTLYPSTQGTPVETLIHSGGHRYPEEAPAAIVSFLKSQARR